MGKANRKRRQRERRATRAAEAALRAVRVAEVAGQPRTSKGPQDQVTDISALRVSPADVMAAGVRSEPMRWCIARCSPMAERKVMDAMTERKIVAYLPMHRFYRRLRGVRHETARPLMVGYVFVGLAPHQSTYDLRRISGVEGVLQSNGATAFISPWAVVQIAALEAARAFDHTSHKPVFSTGQVVRIVTGWAAGQQAKVIEAEDGGLRVSFDAGIFKGCRMPMAVEHVEDGDGRLAA